MTKAHHLATRKPKPPVKTLPLNFLLGCAQGELGNFELARLDEVAHLRAELHTILDRLIDQMSQAALASWFKAQDRQTLKHAIENEESPVEWADRMIRERQRSEEEQELIPLPGFNPEAAHLAAALRYQQRNIAEGKCAVCPKPLDESSVRYCTRHLAIARHRKTPQGREVPGSLDYLYSDSKQPSTHGREPGTLASLEVNREKKTRAVLAELGIPPESAAVSLKAAKDALLKVMPESKADAKPMLALFEFAVVPSRTTGQKALNELLSEGKIQRIGKGGPRELYRYFAKRGEK